MGVEITLDGGYVLASLPGETVKGGEFTLEPSSVRATINLVLGAVKRAEKFVIHNAAREPDVVLLCNMLTRMGADITGIGTDPLTIRKTDTLSGVEMRRHPNRIEPGTFILDAA